jgi:inositol transport system permease protein
MLKKTELADIIRKYGIVAVLIVLSAASAIINPHFLKIQNILNIFKQISVVTIIACAQTMLIVSGMIDLSAGLVCTTAACFSAGVLAHTQNVPLAIFTGIAIGMAAGWINGFLVSHYKLQPFIATLAMTNIAKGIVQIYTNGAAVSGVEKIRWLGQGDVLGFPVPVIVMLLVVIIVFLVMKYTTLGINIYAIGGNEKAAAASGVNVNRVKRIIFTLSGALVGLSGVVLMSRLMAGMPSVGAGYEFDAITAVIVGGTSFLGGIGTAAGTLIGAVIVGLINNILNLLHISTQYQLIVKGILIAGAVIIDMKTKTDKKSL